MGITLGFKWALPKVRFSTNSSQVILSIYGVERASLAGRWSGGAAGGHGEPEVGRGQAGAGRGPRGPMLRSGSGGDPQGWRGSDGVGRG